MQRRTFLKQAAISGALAGNSVAKPVESAYPRIFTGRQLQMLAFPLGGVGAGSISLGGRGQLRDWEIFNRPEKGKSPAYAFPSIWIRNGGEPIVRVLEARLQPPYEGPSGLGSNNVPGLPRLKSCTFTGEFPVAQIAFQDARLPFAFRSMPSLLLFRSKPTIPGCPLPSCAIAFQTPEQKRRPFRSHIPSTIPSASRPLQPVPQIGSRAGSVHAESVSRENRSLRRIVRIDGFGY